MFKKVVGLMVTLLVIVGLNTTNLIAQTKLEGVKFVQPPLDFEETDLKTALISVFAKVGVQYSFDGEVTGKATLHLTEKMPLDDVLITLLSPKDIFWEKDKIGVYHIGKPGVGQRKPEEVKILITKIYPLIWANCLDIARIIKPSLSADGQVNTEPATNSVIITDVATSFEGVEKIINQFDSETLVKTKLLVIKVKLVEISKTTTTNLAIDARYKLEKNIGGTNFGANNSWGTFGSTAMPGVLGANFIWNLGISDAYAALLLNSHVDSINLVAEPELMVEDGTEAKIIVGQRFPIPQVNVSQSAVTTTVTYEDINFTLRVTPKANKDGTIAVTINPELKDIAGFSTISSAGATGGAITNDVPIINTREVKTKLYVRNGGTIKIGGMFKDKNLVAEDKIPILGDIPFLGLLFKRYKPSVERIEMVIMLNPYIFDFSPPTCKNTPWISELTATLEIGNDVRVDWSKDVPFGAHKFSIVKYKIYREDEPITSLEDLDPLVDNVSGESTYWIDTTKKSRGRTYYYVVTAINASGMQQVISSDAKYNAVITIPEEE